MDYYNHRTPYYDLAGTIVTWGLDENSTTCEYPPVNDGILRYFKTTRENMTVNQDSAIMVFWSAAMKANCGTVAQVGLAAEKFSREVLEKAGYPPLSLLVLASHPAGRLPMWGPRMRALRSVDPSVPDGPPNVPALFLDGEDTKAIYPHVIERMLKRNVMFQFAATQEPGIWNDIYLSDGFMAFVWILTILLGVATLYAIARVVRMMMLKQLLRDLRLAIVVLAAICNICKYSGGDALYQTHLVIAGFFLTTSTLAGRSLSIIYQLLSVIIFDMLLWHWSVRGRNVFSRPLVITFRIVIVCHVLLHVCNLGFDVYLAASWLREGKNAASLAYKRYIQPIISVFGAVAFAAFGVWFIRAVYQLRKHSEARSRFIQLSVLSFLAAFTFVVTSANVIITGDGDQTASDYTVEQVVFFDIADMIIFSIRGLVCLGVLGVAWPTATQELTANTNGTRVPGWSTRMWRRLISAMGTGRGSSGSSGSGTTPDNSTGVTDVNNTNRASRDPRINLLGEESTIDAKMMGESVVQQTLPAAMRSIPEGNSGSYFDSQAQGLSTIELETVHFGMPGAHEVSTIDATDSLGIMTMSSAPITLAQGHNVATMSADSSLPTETRTNSSQHVAV
ncbi:hypothetical protein THASP1DRAFT_24867 [Thamnocephalis sphaerospora]|uniref:Uncharacterized protein n=1 Tax=Thamnocephalis sphaerospora TaxID=78915 RepID=A0A4P9XM08_9FUNG|nr:hypothetical protein THASP1DRAFT_24867 [Thamnocephalis sphaerospora]|eukprot:RKP06885.1 hypothetical protein THASP1DRAFT_24867 [Thamnocephalis sphaerospora]